MKSYYKILLERNLTEHFMSYSKDSWIKIQGELWWYTSCGLNTDAKRIRVVTSGSWTFCMWEYLVDDFSSNLMCFETEPCVCQIWGVHGGEDLNCDLLGWHRVVLEESATSISRSTYSLTIEAAGSFETLLKICKTARRHTTEDNN
jgi:hypothetical protein